MPFDWTTFHRRAVETPSHEDVTAMRELLVDTLREAGHDPTVGSVGTVVASRGPGREPHLVLNTHIDTVPPDLGYERDGERVRGRGACDAKGPLAALLEVFCAATVASGRLTLAVSPDEETSQHGGASLAESLDADGYIVGEPTGLDVCHAARGAFGGCVTVHGEAAHASDPDAGHNAIRAALPVVEALAAYDDDRGPGYHDVLGAPTLAPTRIEAGGPLNQIPGACTVGFDRRSVPPETSESFFGDLQSYLSRQFPEEDVEVSPAYPDSPDPDPFTTDPDAELVGTLAAASGGAVRPFEAATEASYFAPKAPTVVFGPGVLADEDGPVAHSNREYIHRPAIGAAADAVRETVEALLG